MASTVRIIDTCKISPFPESATESTLPLTFFDTLWFKFRPNELIFFYELTADSFSSILTELKQSLSLTLAHFLPLAGNIVWPLNSDKPFVLYTAGDAISLSVAESTADFHTLSGDSIRETPELRRYIPKLSSSDTQAAILSFQITLFPSQGFSIAMSGSHTIFDGHSLKMFLTAWVYMHKQTRKVNGYVNLPPELSPCFDRTFIQDPEGLDMFFLNLAKQSANETNPKSLKLPSATPDPDTVRATFKLSSEDINKIRQMALISSTTGREGNELYFKHFSRFVLVYSYVVTALAKAKGIEQNKNWLLIFSADLRSRLDPPLPSNYFGSCVTPLYWTTEVGCLVKRDGLFFVAEELTKMVKGLDKGALLGMKHKIQELRGGEVTSMQRMGVGGSPRFDVYGADFGWGKPKKVQSTSIDSGTSFSIWERRDENAIEVGLVLNKNEMEIFHSQFSSDFLKPKFAWNS